VVLYREEDSATELIKAPKEFKKRWRSCGLAKAWAMFNVIPAKGEKFTTIAKLHSETDL